MPLNFEIHFGPTLLSNENHQKSNKNNLKVVGNENGGGSGLLQMFDTKSRTMAIDIYLPFEHAGFVYKSNFRFCLL